MSDKAIPSYERSVHKAQEELLKYLFDKAIILRERKNLVERPFFLWRNILKKRVKEIDAELNSIDENITKYRRIVMGKKFVRCIDHKILFYRSDGWTLSCLQRYLDADIYDSMANGDSRDDSYFTVKDVNSSQAAILFQCEVLSVIQSQKKEGSDRDNFCRLMGA